MKIYSTLYFVDVKILSDKRKKTVPLKERRFYYFNIIIFRFFGVEDRGLGLFPG